MAAALYSPPPERNAGALAKYGLTPEDFGGPPEVKVYPDCWQAFQVFNALRTQWRTGLGGRTGLDYAALTKTFWKAHGVKKARRVDVFADLAVMEHAALEAMATTKGTD